MSQQLHVSSEVLTELADLLAQVCCTHLQADYQEGQHWTVYVHPCLRDEEDAFDALFSITATTQEAGSGTGLRLVLQRDRVTWLPAGVTNRRGQVWFKRLPFGQFQAQLRHTPDMIADVEDTAYSMGALAAESHPSARPDTAPPAALEEDIGMLGVLLEENHARRAVLTIHTAEPTLSMARVRCVLGQETIEVVLEPAPLPGAWSGSQVLRQPFAVAAAAFPPTCTIPSSSSAPRG